MLVANLKGPQGFQGSQGAAGLGSQGAQGFQGSQGLAGLGSQGSQGFQGSQGAAGSGSQGSQGSQGFQGVAGNTFAGGGNIGAAATSATTGTMTVTMDTAVKTITPTGACTFNASGGVAGQLVTFVILTSGVSSFTLTWNTNFKAVGTLATGTSNNKRFSITFRCVDGTLWQEIGRTAAM